MSYVRDALCLAGGVTIIFGFYQCSLPLACIVGGGMLVVGAIAWSIAARSSHDS